MELIKDLPEVFEEFAEQRKNSFLALKKIKDQGHTGSRCILYLLSKRDRHGYGSCHCRLMLYI